MTKIKDRIMEAHRYRPTPAQEKRARRGRKGLFTEKKIGDFLFDERGRCYEVVKGGLKERVR